MGNEDNLEKRVQRIEDILEIYNLHHRYVHHLAMGNTDKILELFALEMPDVSIEAGDSGVFLGGKKIENLFNSYAVLMAKAVGDYTEHRISQPVIEVAGDGKTAKGMWISCGIMTSGEIMVQAWTWAKWKMEYIKIDGRWKMWHFHWMQTFESDCEKGWIEDRECALSTMRVPPLYPPSKPTTHHLPYNPFRVNVMGAMPPEPYDSYEE